MATPRQIWNLMSRSILFPLFDASPSELELLHTDCWTRWPEVLAPAVDCEQKSLKGIQ
jgi:hypothetical protein